MSGVLQTPEYALRLQVGGIEVWREQLAHLLRVSVRTYVSIRIIPASAGIHAGTTGGFYLMRFPKFPPVVFLDSLNCCLFFDDTEIVRDSKAPATHLPVSADAWSAFLSVVRRVNYQRR